MQIATVKTVSSIKCIITVTAAVRNDKIKYYFS